MVLAFPLLSLEGREKQITAEPHNGTRKPNRNYDYS